MAVIQQPIGTIRPSARVPLPLIIIGVALALVVGLLAALGHDRTTFVAALALPLVILLFRYPWTAVLLFLAIQPLIVVGDGVAGPENWAVGGSSSRCCWRWRWPTGCSASVAATSGSA